MALHVGLLLVWVCWRLSVVGQLLEGDKCFFPFYYKNAIYHDCIKFEAKQKWCSLNETYKGYWKYCSEGESVAHLHPVIPAFVNSTCVFPFMYGDVVYHNCISVHSSYDWCSLDKKFQGRWRYCTGKDPPVCVFPFFFRKKLFHRCTKEGYILNRSWCSLTKNYHDDRKWKQCSPYHI
ncbi:binder of sperm protein homolog 2 isoform X2 [Rhinolophus sinicus]|uniref:binder of sperm protein homolog 2 isoform X2 n=1 Tax=Rhinolophus sinicus TaxID=89399 RepID=UPI003D7B6E35